MEDLPGYNVKSETHQKTLIENFFKLRESGTLVDCLLEVEGRYLKAHKVILSACSLYFSDLFSQHQGTMFKLSDVSFHELEIGIEFIYKGEIVIPQDQLPKFLTVAETLKINGLFENESSDLENNNCVSEHNLETEQNKLGNLSTDQHKMETHTEASSTIPADSIFYSSKSKGASSREGSQCPKLKKRKIDEVMISKSDSINAQSDCEFLNITENNKEFTEPKKIFCKILSDREDTEGPVSKKTKVVKMKNVDSINVKQEEEVLQKLKVAHDADDKSQRQNFVSLGIRCKKTKKKKIVVSHRKPLANLTAKKSQGLKKEKLSCPQCKRTYHGKNNLNKHLKYRCGKEAQFQCDICHTQKKQKRHLVDHMMRKHGQTYSCPQCKKTYNEKKIFNQHLKYECGKEEAQFQCDNCPKKTMFKHHLASHMRKHNPQQGETYSCPRCGKTYTARGHVTNHVKYECGKEPQFQCKICLKKMRLKCHLALHMIKKHNSQFTASLPLQGQPYSCPRCEKSYNEKNNLTNHVKYECGKEPQFECDICHKKIMHKRFLAIHMKIHF